MKYRLLALNIDGTILRSNMRLSRQTKDAIEYAKKKGVYVTLATGRPFIAAKKIAKALKLEGHLITHNGAFIGSNLESPLYSKRISEETAFQIVEILDQYHCHYRLLHESFAIANKVRQKKHLIAKMTIGMNDPLYYPVSYYDSVLDRLMEDPISPPKIQVQFFDDEERASALSQIEREISNITVNIKDEHRLEFFAEGTSKLHALIRLGSTLGIELEEMVAIGSSEDDIDMVAQVGLGVAMGNASQSVKDVASWITRSNNMNGVAYTVKEVFRKQMKIEK